VAAGLGQGLPADDEAWSGGQALLEGIDESISRTAHVAHGGKASRQHLSHDALRMKGDQRIGEKRILPEIHQAGHDMHVAVDKAGHQGPAPQIDRAGAGVPDRLIGDLPDEPTFGTNETIVLALRASAIEQTGILENDSL
jgi:hypothetical protein